MSNEDKPPFRPYKKHILVCTGPRCAPESSPALYQLLKERLKELGVHEEPNRIQRTQCNCFGVCKGGPIVAVYPDGVWYHQVTPERLERILHEHVLQGKAVEDCILYSASASSSQA